MNLIVSSYINLWIWLMALLFIYFLGTRYSAQPQLIRKYASLQIILAALGVMTLYHQVMYLDSHIHGELILSLLLLIATLAVQLHLLNQLVVVGSQTMIGPYNTRREQAYHSTQRVTLVISFILWLITYYRASDTVVWTCIGIGGLNLLSVASYRIFQRYLHEKF